MNHHRPAANSKAPIPNTPSPNVRQNLHARQDGHARLEWRSWQWFRVPFRFGTLFCTGTLLRFGTLFCFGTQLCLCVLCSLFGVPAFAQNEVSPQPNISQPNATQPNASATFQVQPQTDQAVQRGLDYFRQRLRDHQPLGDGAYRENPAVTALVGMAFLASGNTPQDGPDAEHVRQCLETLLAQTRPNGVIAPETLTGQALMYSHGFGVTFLAECLGVGGPALDARIRETLEKAVRVIQKAQASCGGWRYTLTPEEEDVSVTACMLVALRACRNAGLDVPAETVSKATQYLQQCQNPDGGFRYRLAPGQSAYPRTAAVVTAMFTGGVYEGPALDAALSYLTVARAHLTPDDGYYPYAMYYAIQALWLCDRSEPQQSWLSFYREAEQELVRLQKPNGSWSSSISTDYATAMALIVLQIPNNTLPILQH